MLLPIFLAVLVALAVRQLWWVTPDRVVLSGPAMGTTWSVTLNARSRSRADLAAVRSAVEASLAFVNRLMSTWDPDSELSRFNRRASTEPVALSPETVQVLHLAREISHRTGGAFDVTVGPLVAAWGFGAGARAPGAGPDALEIEALRARVGFHLLEIDAAAGTVRKRRPDVECDLSAIAKGFAVDEVARTLAGLGWSGFLVEVGGEVRAQGERPEGGLWRVGIERPDDRGRRPMAVVELRDESLATSGDYRSFYVEEGRRLSHLLDPRTGRPVSHPLASVSVIHRDAVLADAWATALAVLGPGDGFDRAEAEGLAAYFVVRTEEGGFEFRATRHFPSLVAPRAGDPPGDAAAPRDG